jgi:hypothetical protein
MKKVIAALVLALVLLTGAKCDDIPSESPTPDKKCTSDGCPLQSGVQPAVTESVK